MFEIISKLFSYLFIFFIYLFMFGIIRLIYLDIKSMNFGETEHNTYLKLINRKDTLPFKVREAYILEPKSSIGRDNENNIVIKDPFISKQHAAIVKDENKYFIKDLNSSNGTYVNGQIIRDVVKLKNGDRLKIGQVNFVFVTNE